MAIIVSPSGSFRIRPPLFARRGMIRASGTPVFNDDAAIDRWSATAQLSWQKRAGEYVKKIPELEAAITYLGRKGNGAIVRAKKMDPDGDLVLDDDPRAQAFARTLATFDMQRAIELLALYGKFYAIEINGKWTIASIRELQPPDGKDKPWQAIDKEGDNPRPLWKLGTPPNMIPRIVEIWRPMRDFAAMPWAATASLLDACETLVLVRARRKAYLLSRLLGSGVYYIPSEAMMPEIVNDPTTGFLPRSAGQKFRDAATAIMRNPEHPTSAIPILVTGPAEYAKAFTKLEFDNSDHPDKLRNDEQDALISLGTGLDLPRAVVLNEQGDAAFWASWEISRDVINGYVKPYVGLVARGVTDGWYQNLLKMIGITDYENRFLEEDVVSLLPQPNEVGSAISLYNIGLITDEAVLETAGYSTELMMMPGTPEWNRWTQRIAAQSPSYPPLPLDPGLTDTGLTDNSTDALPLMPTGGEPPVSPPGTNAANAVIASLELMLNIRRASSDGSQHKDGVMLSLKLPKEAASKLAVPDGIPADDMHVTLAYLGKADEVDKYKVANALASLPVRKSPLKGSVGHGNGIFRNPDENAVWASVDVPGLAEYHTDLMRHLDEHGIKQASEHGFTPHVTLYYTDNPDEEIASTSPVDVAWDNLTFTHGEEETQHSFTGDSVTAAVSQDKKLEKLAKTLNAIDNNLRMKLQGAAERTIQVAMRKAASRVNGKANGKASIKAMIATLGPTHEGVIAALGLTENELVQDEIDGFTGDAAQWIKEADATAAKAMNKALGTNLETVGKSEDHTAAVLMLAAGMLALARAKLHQPDMTESPKGEVSGLRVPAPLITATVAKAGGAEVEIRGTPASPSIHWGEKVAAGPATSTSIDEIIIKAFRTPSLPVETPFLPNSPDETYTAIHPPSPPEEPPSQVGKPPRQDGRNTPKRWLIWRHGSPIHPFKPHAELDGVRFDVWNDDRLGFVAGDNTDILGSGAQIGGWRPGDHRGCTCTIEIDWEYDS